MTETPYDPPSLVKNFAKKIFQKSWNISTLSLTQKW